MCLKRLQYGCFMDSLNRNRRGRCRQQIASFTCITQPDCPVGAGSKVQLILSLFQNGIMIMENIERFSACDQCHTTSLASFQWDTHQAEIFCLIHKVQA